MNFSRATKFIFRGCSSEIFMGAKTSPGGGGGFESTTSLMAICPKLSNTGFDETYSPPIAFILETDFIDMKVIRITQKLRNEERKGHLRTSAF